MGLLNWIKSAIKKNVEGSYENLVKNQKRILSDYTQTPQIKGVIVSLTTYHPRVDFFEYAILSLLNGSRLPEKILVYVPKGFKELLATKNSILKNVYTNGIVEFVVMEEDVFCHSKYYYAFEKYGKEKNIVLSDDDVIYYKDWLLHLYETACRNEEYDVFAYKAVQVGVKNGKIDPYDDWLQCSSDNLGKGSLLYTEAVGGVLYRKGFLQKEVLNKPVFLNIVPKADDVWLWFCTYLNGGKIMYVPTKSNKKLLYTIPNSQEVALWKENTFSKRNDKYVEDCRRYFIEKYNFDIAEQGS